MNRMRVTALFSGLVIAALALAGCTYSSGVHASRHTLYDSLEGIAGDSTTVALVEVVSQEVVKDDVESTISTIKVIEGFAPAGLGASLPTEALARAAEQPDFSEGTVSQLGTSAMTTTPAPILATGRQYLLFLTPTMLKSDGPTNFYVTGGDAGIYEVTGDGTFRHEVFEAGDRLPTVLDAATLGRAG